MKPIVLFSITYLLSSIAVFGQSKIEKIETLISQEQMNKAVVLVDELLLTDTNNPKLLLYKAMIIQNRIEIAMPSELKKQILDSAYHYYSYSLANDKQKLLSPIISENLQTVVQQYSYTGMELFNEGKYQSALAIFERNIELTKLPIINNLDTMMLYNSAITAEKLKDFAKAEKYYKEILLNKPKDKDALTALVNIYKTQGKTKAYFSLIKKGSIHYPRVLMFQQELIAYYLEHQKTDSALIYIDQLLLVEQPDDKLYYLKASILQEQGDFLSAEKEYTKCLEINPNNPDALFNLAVNYYNNAVTLLLKEKKNKAEEQSIKDYLKQSLKYLERVRKLEPNNKYIWSMLLLCYQELGMQQKKEEVENYIETQNKDTLDQ